MLAVREELNDIAVQLLDKIKSNPDKSNSPLKTAFFLAVQEREFKQIENYIKRDNTLINIKKETAKAALYIARLNGDEAMIDYLHKKHLAAGFDKNID